MTTNTNARAIADSERQQLEGTARAAMPASQYLDSIDLEELTGTKASTWRYWAMTNQGPRSFKLGRRRVWKRSTVLAWLQAQENVG